MLALGLYKKMPNYQKYIIVFEMINIEIYVFLTIIIKCEILVVKGFLILIWTFDHFWRMTLKYKILAYPCIKPIDNNIWPKRYTWNLNSVVFSYFYPSNQPTKSFPFNHIVPQLFTFLAKIEWMLNFVLSNI